MIQSKDCLFCGLKFEKQVNVSKKRWNTRVRYCSKSCADIDKKGRPLKHSKQFKKGQIAWNKGLPGLKDEDNPTWKGAKVGYSGLHKWVASKLGKPNTCEFCLKNVSNPYRIHWANKSHRYKRDLTDWLRLCARCHIAYDRS